MTDWLWWAIGIDIVALGLAIAYGVVHARGRSPAAQARSEAATDRLYRKEDQASE